jgi:solute carrier family 35 (UDP-sugar transporter), member A1/2/3
MNLKNLFPTRESLGIFVCYIALFVAQGKIKFQILQFLNLILIVFFCHCILGIFVKSSQNEQSAYNYDTISLVLLTEVLKLALSSILYCRE